MRSGVTTQIQRTAGWRGVSLESRVRSRLMLDLNRRLGDVPDLRLSVVDGFSNFYEVTARTPAGDCMVVVPYHLAEDERYLNESAGRIRQLLDEASKPAA
jgi:hypothetical protein